MDEKNNWADIIGRIANIIGGLGSSIGGAFGSSSSSSSSSNYSNPGQSASGVTKSAPSWLMPLSLGLGVLLLFNFLKK